MLGKTSSTGSLAIRESQQGHLPSGKSNRVTCHQGITLASRNTSAVRLVVHNSTVVFGSQIGMHDSRLFSGKHGSLHIDQEVTYIFRADAS